MAAYKRRGKRWSYRKTVTLCDGSKQRISGTPERNTRRAAEDAERAHVDRVMMEAERRTGVRMSVRMVAMLAIQRLLHNPGCTEDDPCGLYVAGKAICDPCMGVDLLDQVMPDRQRGDAAVDAAPGPRLRLV